MNNKKRAVFEREERRKMLASSMNRGQGVGVMMREEGEGHALDEVKPA